jgi:hypothetical protein
MSLAMVTRRKKKREASGIHVNGFSENNQPYILCSTIMTRCIVCDPYFSPNRVAFRLKSLLRFCKMVEFLIICTCIGLLHLA